MNPTYTDSYTSDTEAADFSSGTESTSSTSTSTSNNGVAQAVSDAVGQVKDQVAPAVQQTKEKATEVAHQVTEKAASRLDEKKASVAEGLTPIVDALRGSGQQFRNQGDNPIPQFAAQYGDLAADQIERVSNYLRDKDTREIVHDVEDFARREPAIFIGGALLLGILAGRFLRSSAPAGSTAHFTSNPPVKSTALSLPTEDTTLATPSSFDTASIYDTPASTSLAEDAFSGNRTYESEFEPDLTLLDDSAFPDSTTTDKDTTDVSLNDDLDLDSPSVSTSDNTFSTPIKG